MKCDVDIRKIGIKCEFDDGYDFADARDNIMYAVQELFNLEYINNYQDSLYITRVIKNGIKVIGKIYSGMYHTRLENLEQKEKFYFYIELEESFNADENYNGGLTYLDDECDEYEYDDVEYSTFHSLFSIICTALEDNKIKFMLHDLTVTLKIPAKNGELKDNLVFILDSLKNKYNTYSVKENNFRIIDDNFKQHITISNTSDKFEIDFNIKRTYIFSSGFYKQDVIDILTKKFMVVLYPLRDYYIGSYDRINLSLSDEDLDFLEDDQRIISFDFNILNNFFEELDLKN